MVCSAHEIDSHPQASAPLPAHMVKAPSTRPVTSKFRLTTPRVTKATPKEKAKQPEQMMRLEEYFARPSFEKFRKSSVPFAKKDLMIQFKQRYISKLQRILIHGRNRFSLGEFSLEKSSERPVQPNDNWIVQPVRSMQSESLSVNLRLKWAKILSEKEAEELELLGRCLGESCDAEDEVTRELLFLLEYFSRRVLPSVNSFKQLLQMICDKVPAPLPSNHLEDCAQKTGLVIQWGFIYRNSRFGLKDKEVEVYQGRVQNVEGYEIEEIDCSVCFFLNEDELIINPMLHCTGCKLYVHKACYGCNFQENFQCAACKENAAPRCFICLGRRGLMKQAGNEWFHVACALWEWRCFDFEDHKRLEGLKPIGHTLLGSCFRCKKDGGILSKCRDCSALCHLMCAWKSGMLFLTGEAVCEAPIRKVDVQFLCPTHTPKRDFHTQKKLRRTAYKYHIRRFRKKRTRDE